MADRLRRDGPCPDPCPRGGLASRSSVDRRHLRCSGRRRDRYANRRPGGQSRGGGLRDLPASPAPASTSRDGIVHRARLLQATVDSGATARLLHSHCRSSTSMCRSSSARPPPSDLRPRILELRARLAAAVGDAPSSDRTLREALDLYRAISATGHADRLARELELSVKTRVNLAATHRQLAAQSSQTPAHGYELGGSP
jgi:hypothetical protein